MKYNKKERKMFVKSCKEIILKNNGVFIKEDGFDEYIGFVYELKTKNNLINIHLYNEFDHTRVLSVFMRYEIPTKNNGNSYSGKHNFHSMDDVLTALQKFEDFLTDAINND